MTPVVTPTDPTDPFRRKGGDPPDQVLPIAGVDIGPLGTHNSLRITHYLTYRRKDLCDNRSSNLPESDWYSLTLMIQIVVNSFYLL